MFTALALLLLTQTPPPEPPLETFSAPPMVSSEAPAEAPPASIAPVFEARVLATGTAITWGNTTLATFGARAELDLFRVALTLSYDRFITSALALSDLQSLTVLGGYSVVAHRFVRLRVLGGVDARWSDASQLGPSLGATVRAGFRFLSLDAAVTFTPLPFRRVDARLGLALSGSPFELQGGLRAQVLDTTEGGSLGTLFATASEVGPYLALGLAL